MDNQNMDLQAYVDKLVAEKKGFEGLDQEVLTQIKKDLLERVETRMNAVFLANLPEDKQEEFSKLLDKDDEAQLRDFATANVPDLPEIMASELIAFRQSYLG